MVRASALPTGGQTTAQPGGGAPVASTQGGANGGDALDKGVNAALNRAGHGQKPGTVEKISDGLRKVFKKATGKDAPIKDQEMR
ncbi:hypothetical protein DMC30DRAFT_419377 [Rhodotorula diobovata]|uniref:Uncharacterized protein n=1 Tax=Rhodotorula diobovata TaxID=5288 RepID=A0A5C5FNJ6_9BASI|nr:hypothetical protein DMC30DRAFT_419377 [Rhodotorula diobovata]